MKAIIALFIAALLTGCGTLSPETLGKAVIGHSTFPSLSQTVSACLSDHPEIRSQAKEPWSRLVDKWASADDLEPNSELLVVLAGAQHQIVEAKADWLYIKSLIVSSSIDCGPAIVQQVKLIEEAFAGIETAIKSNERVVYALQYTTLLASIVTGRSTGVMRL